jgi:hypothetical protein
MTGAKALTLGYVAQQARYDDFHRTAAERRRHRRNGSAKPGSDDRVREAHPVPKYRRLLRVAR